MAVQQVSATSSSANNLVVNIDKKCIPRILDNEREMVFTLQLTPQQQCYYFGRK